MIEIFMALQFRGRFFTALCFFAFSAQSAPLSSADSLSLNMSGAAAISALHGAGAKASENGLLVCSIDHFINDRVRATCAIRGGGNDNRAFIERAALEWLFGQNEADAGFVSHRYGACELYRPYSIFNFLFDKPVLWDMYGFGFTYKRRMGASFGLTAGSSINTRENGQINLLLSMDKSRFAVGLFEGFQTYSMENQDNGLTSGLEASMKWQCSRIHGIAKYSKYFGYGHASNSTMIPGESAAGLVEISWLPVSSLDIREISYILKTKKRYDHEFLFEAMEASWMIVRHWGIGCGCEWQKGDDVESLMPRCFVKAVPSADRAELEISLQPTIVRREVVSWRAAGELWMHL